MSSQCAARAVRYNVPHLQPAAANSNACFNCLNTVRTLRSLRSDQLLLLSVVQQHNSKSSCTHLRRLGLDRRRFHSSSRSLVGFNWQLLPKFLLTSNDRMDSNFNRTVQQTILFLVTSLYGARLDLMKVTKGINKVSFVSS